MQITGTLEKVEDNDDESNSDESDKTGTNSSLNEKNRVLNKQQ